MPDQNEPRTFTAPAIANAANVYIVDGKVCVMPSQFPLLLTPDAALGLAESIRAAALGAADKDGA